MSRLLFLLVDGFGLSASHRQNAILTARPENFFYLWQNFPHAVLNPIPKGVASSDFAQNSEIAHTYLASGQQVDTYHEQVNNAIRCGELAKNDVIQECLKASQSQINRLHLFFTVSSNNLYGDSDHFNYLLNLTKQYNTGHLLVHLILSDESVPTPKLNQKINQIISAINKLDNCRLVSVTGQSSLLSGSKSFQQVYQNIIFGQGDKALSIEQLLDRAVKNKSYCCNLASYKLSDSQNSRDEVGDFDLLFFADYCLKPFNYLISILSEHKSFFGRRLPQMRIFSLVEPDNISKLNVKSALFPILRPSIAKSLDRQDADWVVNLALSRQHHWQNYFGTGKAKLNIFSYDDLGSKKYQPLLSKLVQVTKDQLQEHKAKLIMTEVSTLVDIAGEVTLDQSVRIIKEVDSHIADLVKQALSNEYDVLILSNHGWAESHQGSTIFSVSHYPIPIIWISREHSCFNQKKVTDSFILKDLLVAKYSLVDVLPTIFDLLRLDAVDGLEGESLLKSGLRL